MNVQVEVKAPRDAWLFYKFTDSEFAYVKVCDSECVIDLQIKQIRMSIFRFSSDLVNYFTKDSVTQINKKDFMLLPAYFVKIEQFSFKPLIDNWLFNSKVYFMRI